MKRMVVMFVGFLMLVSLAHAAHPRRVDIVGTIVFISEGSIAVKSADDKIRTVMLNNSTMFLKNDSPALLKHIGIGDLAVVHAMRVRKSLLAGAVEVGTSEVKQYRAGCTRCAKP